MKPIRTRIEILEAGDAALKASRTMTDQELDAEIARLSLACAALPKDPDSDIDAEISEIDAEIARLTKKLYPTTDRQDTRGTEDEQAN